MNGRQNQFILTLPDVLQKSASLFPEKPAVIEGARSISYKDLEARSNSLAHYLIEKGIKKGDRVGIFLDKSIESVLSIWGILKAGGIFVYINPHLTTEQVRYHIENCSMKCVISSDKKKIALGTLECCVIINCKDFESIFINYASGAVHTVDLIETDLAAILYTSGSTGFPKGAVFNHKNLILGTQIVASYLENTEEDVIISVLPFNFDYGLNQLFTALLVGGQLVLQKAMFSNEICRTLIDKQITGFAGVPTIWIQLLQEDICSFKYLEFPKLRYITNSGGGLPVPCLTELRKVLKSTKIYLMYGLTEAFRSTYLPPKELDRRPTSIGKAIPNVQISVINKEGKECAPGEEGELVHRGGVIFQGYWDNPEATEKVLKPFPFAPKELCAREMAVWSGDTVKRDKDGFLYFIGRNDEMIKSAGNRISPQEIETVLYRMEEIKEVVVFGIKDDMLGNKIKAVVSLKTDKRAPPQDIKEYCKKALPYYMVPQDIVIMDELPKTVTGKLDRVRVKQLHTNVQPRSENKVL